MWRVLAAETRDSSRHRRIGETLYEAGDPLEDVVDRRAVLRQVFSSFVGDLVDLFAASSGTTRA